MQQVSIQTQISGCSKRIWGKVNWEECRGGCCWKGEAGGRTFHGYWEGLRTEKNKGQGQQEGKGDESLWNVREQETRLSRCRRKRLCATSDQVTWPRPGKDPCETRSWWRRRKLEDSCVSFWPDNQRRSPRELDGFRKWRGMDISGYSGNSITSIVHVYVIPPILQSL